MFISSFMFLFANDLLLIILHLLYAMEIMLDKKTNSSDFLSSELVIKQWRQLTTSAMHLSQELEQTYSAVVVQEVLQRRGEA